jgi:cobaltochelatase CobN
MVLWGFETSNTGGETIGQILTYLGVRIKRGFNSFSPELLVIPLEELKRPRIDVHLSICGFFRDMFPNVITLLNNAFALVSERDEPDEMNYVRMHSRENLEEMNEKIQEWEISLKKAKKIAYGRIYGPRAGEYGTRMLPLLEDSIWKEEKDLADVYLEQMAHLYTDGIHGEKSPDSYQKNLSHVQLVSQVRDRNDREIIDLDHYFEYFGGLTKAVETVSGKTPVMLISDTTKEVIETVGISTVITRGMRTRLLNPKWIDEMLKHDFHGAQQIEERVYNTLVWLRRLIRWKTGFGLQ